jgi:AcrR family transcriptional regulator
MRSADAVGEPADLLCMLVCQRRKIVTASAVVQNPSVTNALGRGAAASAARRAEQKAANRAKLIAAARKVFAEKGLGEATARDIVRQTDLATGTFYNHFRDKEDVFRALLEELSARAREAVRAERQAGETLERRLESAFGAYFSLVVSERDLFLVIRRNAGVVANMTDEGLFGMAVAELFEDLADWRDAGEFPAVDIDYLASSMVAVGFQVANRLVDREPPDARAAARFCAQLFLGGIPALATRAGRRSRQAVPVSR